MILNRIVQSFFREVKKSKYLNHGVYKNLKGFHQPGTLQMYFIIFKPQLNFFFIVPYYR